ncbi:PNGase F N-terminal domain-containing protein [Bizionia sediminis]|uniref:PNGase F N-terminal domain-containing protein n=1 Tax=Bizionia sediminis TaxID=1737064 RepID=A0ABW5KU53_9FLAO
MKTQIMLTFFLLLSVVACKPTLTAIGDTQIDVFTDTHLYFDPNLKTTHFSPDNLSETDSILRLDAGRVLLKKIHIPQYFKQPEVSVQMSLTSNGDPWDKSGSLFIIPASADLNMLDLEMGAVKKEHFPFQAAGTISKQIGGKHFMPNIELLRFMTPFGVGFFNNDPRVANLKPVYIPKWETQVQWTQNITQLLPLLENELYVGVFIDTWTKEGYKLSVQLNFKESTVANHAIKEQQVIPLVNTVKYASKQVYFDAFHKDDLQVSIPVSAPYTNAKLYYLTTGHGGHAEGDEFTQKENVIYLNNTVIKQFVPWRDDCASFRRFNPTSGVWTEKTIWKGQEIEERIASSDYSRSNWCPGSQVAPEVIELGTMQPGDYTFKFSIPEAQAITEDKINYWMVSAYLVFDKN